MGALEDPDALAPVAALRRLRAPAPRARRLNPITHFLVSWTVANAAPLEKRDRAIVSLAGVAPDVDGLGIVPELLTRGTSHPLPWFSEYHHVIAHNVAGAAVATGLAFALARKRPLTAALACVTFHLHLFCDVLGAKGPDGSQWPIPYLLPFSNAWQWTWSGQWELNAWPNMVITAVLLLLALVLAWRRGFSPLEMLSSRADGVLVETLRKRFGAPRSERSA